MERAILFVSIFLLTSRILAQRSLSLPQDSSAFHTLTGIDGHIAICHFYPPHWNAQNTLYQVFMKGRLWIEAYEGHLATGEALSVYLPEQVNPLTQMIDLLSVLMTRP